MRHRSAQAQIHLTVIRARAELVRARTALVNAARGLVKSYGQRLPKCGTQQVNRELAAGLHAELREVLEPLLQEVESLNERTQAYEVRMEKIAKESYPHVELLKQVKGVGTQIPLTYVLTLDDPHRFPKSREVGCFLGLCPGRRDSGESQPQMNISKEGDRYLRTMLVQGGHYILGPDGLIGLSSTRTSASPGAKGGVGISSSFNTLFGSPVSRKINAFINTSWVFRRRLIPAGCSTASGTRSGADDEGEHLHRSWEMLHALAEPNLPQRNSLGTLSSRPSGTPASGKTKSTSAGCGSAAFRVSEHSQ